MVGGDQASILHMNQCLHFLCGTSYPAEPLRQPSEAFVSAPGRTRCGAPNGAPRGPVQGERSRRDGGLGRGGGARDVEGKRRWVVLVL